MFNGFTEGEIQQIPAPENFFHDLLPLIDNLGEIKLTLYLFWRLNQIEGKFQYLRQGDFEMDAHLIQLLKSAQVELDEALSMVIRRGTLLEAQVERAGLVETYYFLNTPQGRAAVEAIAAGRWRETDDEYAPIEIGARPANIFRLYEENIGPLTPMIAEALGEAEDTYPLEWIEDAIRIAVEKNKRNWRYAAAILERWYREGRDGRKEKPEDRRDTEESRRRYVEGKFSEFVER